jgi:catalase
VPHREDDDFIQARMLYQNVVPATDRDHLVDNLIGHLSQGVERLIPERAVRNYWPKIDPELGACIAQGLGLPSEQSSGASAQ